MKKILWLILLSGCATQPPAQNVLYPAPALREVFRGGAIQGLEDNTGQYLGMPNQYDMVPHVCSSTPIYDMYGRYVKTSVRCW